MGLIWLSPKNIIYYCPGCSKSVAIVGSVRNLLSCSGTHSKGLLIFCNEFMKKLHPHLLHEKQRIGWLFSFVVWKTASRVIRDLRVGIFLPWILNKRPKNTLFEIRMCTICNFQSRFDWMKIGIHIIAYPLEKMII